VIEVAIDKPHIVVVEDSVTDVVLLRQALDEHIGKGAYQLQVLPDGGQGMRYVEHSETSAEVGPPDLIVVDINLPFYSGLDILRRLREQSWLAGIPVVILTTSDSRVEREQAERLGISHFLRKPTDLRDFIALGAVLKRCVTAGV
jgi:CheY-like chemotaxis protein